MKKNNKLLMIFLIISFISLSLLLINPVNVLGSSDVQYTFQNDNLFNSTGLGQQSWVDNSSQTFNVRARENITQDFPATYSFTGETGLTGNNISFITTDQSFVGCTSIIENELQGHSEILNLTDNSNSGGVSIYNEFTEEVSIGTIEFWWMTEDVDVSNQKYLYLTLANDTTFASIIGFSYSAGNSIAYNDGTWHEITTGFNEMIWYHIRIDFNCTSDSFDFYVNGILEGDDLPFDLSVDNLSYIRLNTRTNSGVYTPYSHYIDAIGYSWDVPYTEVFYDVSSQDNYPSSITWDGTYFWVVGSDTEIVYKYTDEWVYTTTSFDVSLQDSPLGITWDGTYFWVVGTLEAKIFKYTSLGVYTGFSFNVSDQDPNPMGICWDGTYFWVSGNLAKIHKYTSLGVYMGISFDVSSESTSPVGITWDGNYFWITSSNNGFIYKYTNEWIYTGINFDVNTQENNPNGICWDGNYFWIVGNDAEVYKYIFKNYYYSIGDNTFPVVEIYTDEYEVDKWEFRHDPTTRIQYVDGFDDPSGWTDDEISDGKVNTLNIGGNRDVVVHVDDDGGLYRNFGGLNDTYYNISYNFEINQLDDDDVGANAIILKIDDEEADVICSVYIRQDDTVDVYHDATGTELGSFTRVGNFTATFLINFESQVFNFIFSDWNDGTIIFNFFGGFYNTSATNIRKIYYTHVCTGTDLVDTDIFSISMYNTTGSVSDDIGELRWDQVGYTPTQSEWYFDEFNLIFLEANFQNFSLFHESFGGISFQNFIEWNSENQDFVNIYEVGNSLTTTLTHLRIWMYYNFSFNSISIDGVKMTDGTNSYQLELSYGNINPNQSYFYVDDNSYLSWSMTMNDNDTEYIQANFDIIDFSDDDYSMYIHGYEYSNGYGYFGVNYADSTSISYSMPTYLSTLNNYLNSQREMTEIVILITDNDDYSTGINTGVIRTIEFRYIANADLSLATLTLTNVMLNLVIILIPSLLFYYAFDKKRDVLLISMILMLTVSFASALIPMWLFFLGLMCMGMFFFIKTDEGSF